MIKGRLSAAGFVCLTCRLRLPTGVSVHVTHPRALGTTAHARAGDGAGKRDAHGDDTPKHGPEPGTRRTTASQPPRVYRRRGSSYVITKVEDLAVDVLGRPGEAIVMKDMGRSSKPRPTPAANDAAISGFSTSVENVPDVWGALKNPSNPATLAEAEANINELRPAGVRIVLQREFDAIADILSTGFTAQQLAAYIANNQRRASVSPSSAITPDNTDPPWVLQRLPWVPQDAMEQHRTGSTKEALAAQVIHGCWGISIQELMDGPGQLDLWMRDPEFSLLLVGERRWLQVISRIYLRKVAGRVELRRSDRLVRIVAPKATAETILAEINNVLGTIVTETFSLDLITPNSVSPDALAHLGQLTNSHIQLQASGRQLSVSWVDRTQATRNPSIETTRNLVFRLLLEAYGRAADPSSSSSAVIPKLETDAETGRLVVEAGAQQRKLPWHVRTGKWARLIRPTSTNPCKTSNMRPAAELIAWLLRPKNLDHLRHPTEPLTTAETSLSASAGASIWGPSKTTTYAVFGHVLHWGSDTDTVGRSAGLPPVSSIPPILSTITPPVRGRFFADAALAGPTNTQLLIRLLPSPKDSAAPHAPALELRVRVSNGMVLNMKSLHAVHWRENFDLHLPALPVDARITQRSVSELLRHETPIEMHPSVVPLVDFLSRSQISPSENIYKTPALVQGLSVPIPPRRGGSPATLPSPEGDVDWDLATVDYLFAGLELRHNAVTEFNGRSLAYVTITNPGLGGQRSVQVSLQASRWPGPNPFAEGSEVAAASFVNDVLAVAMGDQLQWFL